MSIFADIKAIPLAQALPELGLQLVKGRWSPCPSCGREQASSSDKRGPVVPYKQSIHCVRCGSLGTLVDGIAWVLLGQPYDNADERHRRELVRFAGAQGWIDWQGERPAKPKIAKPAPHIPATPEREYNPAEFLSVWRDAVDPMHADGDCKAWIRSRFLGRAAFDTDAAAEAYAMHTLSRWGMLRFLPHGYDLPWWGSFNPRDGETKGRSYAQGRFRAVLPMFNAEGKLHAGRFRSIYPTEGLSAMGTRGTSGAVFACPLAQYVMRNGHPPQWWGVEPYRLLVVEGGPDTLSAALGQALRPRDRRWGIVGLVSGAWTPEHALRVPVGSTVAIFTHADGAGDKYAEAVASTLRPRACRLSRARRVAQPVAVA